MPRMTTLPRSLGDARADRLHTAILEHLAAPALPDGWLVVR